MKTRFGALLRTAVMAALLFSGGAAQAVLLDHGPQDPVFVFPTWYRDLNGLALGQCRSQTPSPNPGAGGFPMCFALNPDPLGFPGNLGPELFFTDLVSRLGDRASQGATFFLTYIAALEGTYLPAGLPVHGTETVFARIRVVANISVPGTYKVTHPYGIEVFPDVQAGRRAIFFTADVPIGPPLEFTAALGGRIGPFAQWDFVDPGFALDITSPVTKVTESFVGDPNLDHSFIGSPFGTNYVRVDGPPGSNLDGLGNDFIQSPLAAVLGQKWTAPIPTPLTIKRATYLRDAVKNVIGVDVWATSAPANKMILTGVNLPTVQMVGDFLGNYFAHVEMPATVIPPASIEVTNLSSTPANTAVAGLVDIVTVTNASYDTLTNTLNVTATSSDKLSPPVMTVVGPLGGLMTGGSFSLVLPPTAVVPESVTVQSGAGGLESEEVLQIPGLPMNPPVRPVAVADAFTTLENVAATISVTANDVVTAPATAASILIITPPLNGTAIAGATVGSVTYTPKLNFFGTDSFAYVLVDSTGAMSNVATATATVTFVPPPPTAFPDDFAMLQNATTPLKGRAYNVVANDFAAAGTALNPASVKVTTLPLHGTAVANLDGTVTYTPALKFTGTDTFQYTVSNTAAIASAPATVSATVFAGPETLSIIKAIYTAVKTSWTIQGTTSWFGPALLHTTVTCYVGTGTLGPVIGTSSVDTLGAFVVVSAPSAPPPDATKLMTCKSSNGAQVTAGVTVK